MNACDSPSPAVETDIVIVFVKNPFPGRVKTRFAPEIPHHLAGEIYKCFVADVLAVTAHAGFPVNIACHPPDEKDAVRRWLGPGYALSSQNGRDLGERMANAFEAAFRGGIKRAVLIGSDLPDLTPQVLSTAFKSLTHGDAVIGPAFDGGYYLIGFRDKGFHRDVFRNVAWSTSRVMRQTLVNFDRFGLSVDFLPEMRDMDTFEDIKDFMARPLAPGTAPLTRAFLDALFPEHSSIAAAYPGPESRTRKTGST